MKISKLFHWLYAMVMFLPLFALGISCAYVIFNKNAYESYYGETINDFEDIEVNSFDNLEVGKTYIFTSINSNTSNDQNTKRLNISNINIIQPSANQSFNETLLQSNSLTTTFYGNAYLVPYIDGVSQTGLDMSAYSIVFSFKLESFTYPGNKTYTECWDSFLSYREYNRYSYLDNVFYFSCDQLKQNPFFSWASTSFLSQPITYITGLFGMPSNHIVIYLLSYWLDISIIWLTFDLIMYVPLLVHRWLDKGVLD